MILLIRGLNILKFTTNDIETISSIFTTWGSKLNTIIQSHRKTKSNRKLM